VEAIGQAQELALTKTGLIADQERQRLIKVDEKRRERVEQQRGRDTERQMERAKRVTTEDGRIIKERERQGAETSRSALVLEESRRKEKELKETVKRYVFVCVRVCVCARAYGKCNLSKHHTIVCREL
jgi:hypothetical protein